MERTTRARPAKNAADGLSPVSAAEKPVASTGLRKKIREAAETGIAFRALKKVR